MSEISAGPGRPAIGPAVHFRLPAELLARVDAAAEEDGISRASLIRNALWRMVAEKRFIEHYLKKRGNNIGAVEEECRKVSNERSNVSAQKSAEE